MRESRTKAQVYSDEPRKQTRNKTEELNVKIIDEKEKSKMKLAMLVASRKDYQCDRPARRST